ncbi:MAG: NlpC/P60 family protein [Candidatus Bruticola sp.]
MESFISLFSKFGRKTLIGAASWSLAAVLMVSSAQAHIIYKYYEVVNGDTIESIASRYSVDPKELLQTNAGTIVNNKGLQAGAILLIPINTEARPVPTEVNIDRAESAPSPALVSVNSGELLAVSTSSSNQIKKDTKKKSSRRRSYRRPSAPAPGYSIAIGSDGKIVKIPNYVPPSNDEDEWDNDTPSAGRVDSLLSKAKSYMGVPYVWGGSTPSGFDCSGYVQYVYNQVGVNLPRTADIQFNEGRAVASGHEAPGDMVFFETYAPGASHVGIYLGNGEFIHASSSGSVKVSSLDESYFKARYLGAKRVL